MKYALLLTLIVIAGSSARATLGETVNSIDRDVSMLRATKLQIHSRNSKIQTGHEGVSFTIHDLDVNGIAVREFVNAQGIVFALAWDGARTIELDVLLGRYFSDYERSLRMQIIEPGRKPAALITNQIRVERWGHMGQLHGRAIVPGLVPTPFQWEVIQ
jgi:hypothetical protein